MFRTAARLTALGCWFALAACNENDVVAHGVVASTNLDDGSTESCDIVAQLARAKLPTGLANVFVDCEWPLRHSDNPDQLGELLPSGNEQDAPRADVACAGNPYRWWQEPPLPLPAQRFMYCPKACEVVRRWVRCKLSADVCNREDGTDAGQPHSRPTDGGAPHCTP